MGNGYDIVYRVCTFPYKPLVHCLDNNLQKQTDIYGFHVDIFEAVARKIGLHYILKCIGYTPFLHDMRAGYNSTIGDPISSCDIYIGAQEVTPWLYDRYSISPPLIWSGLNILTMEENRYTFRFLGFLQGFSWDLHITVLSFAIFAACTTVIIAYYTSLYNALTERYRVRSILPEKVRYFINCCLNNIALLANGSIQLSDDHYHANIIPKLHTIGYGFISTVVIAYYTAITTASLAIPKKVMNIKSLSEVRATNLKLGVPLRYVSLTRGQINIQNIVPYNWETNSDMDLMVRDLNSNKVQGVLLDAVVARHFQAQNCKMTTLVQDIFLTYQPVYFRKAMNTSIVDRFAKAVIDELTSDAYNVYNQKYIATGDASCNSPDGPFIVRTKDILGVFMAGLFMCVISVLLTIIRYHTAKMMCGDSETSSTINSMEEQHRKSMESVTSNSNQK